MWSAIDVRLARRAAGFCTRCSLLIWHSSRPDSREFPLSRRDKTKATTTRAVVSRSRSLCLSIFYVWVEDDAEVTYEGWWRDKFITHIDHRSRYNRPRQRYVVRSHRWYRQQRQKWRGKTIDVHSLFMAISMFVYLKTGLNAMKSIVVDKWHMCQVLIVFFFFGSGNFLRRLYKRLPFANIRPMRFNKDFESPPWTQRCWVSVLILRVNDL